MNKRELEKKLIEENIPKDSYCLNGGYLNEAYCLEENYGRWEVYYSERGRKTNVKSFLCEEEACKYLHNELIQIFKGNSNMEKFKREKLTRELLEKLEEIIDSYIVDKEIDKELIENLNPTKIKYILAELEKHKIKELSRIDREVIKDIYFYYC